MGLFSGLLGNASAISDKELQQKLDGFLIDGETIEVGFKVIRDLIVFTNKRMIMIDKQGMTGKKVEYHSIPYRSVDHFAVETAGHFDLDSELKIWIKGGEQISKEFKKGTDIRSLQKVLATFVL